MYLKRGWRHGTPRPNSQSLQNPSQAECTLRIKGKQTIQDQICTTHMIGGRHGTPNNEVEPPRRTPGPQRRAMRGSTVPNSLGSSSKKVLPVPSQIQRPPDTEDLTLMVKTMNQLLQVSEDTVTNIMYHRQAQEKQRL